jgi:serine/threonine protein kinase
MIGQTISHFRILEKLGAGGMGVVYKALDTRLDRPVALKFLPDNMVRDSQALERFRREAHAASAFNHPSICTIYDIGEQDHVPFIAMEFIDGQTLREYIHGQPLPLAQILEFGIQIADALDTAHAAGIIHRDIKPSNVFVTKRGQAKVLDFGLAKLLPRDLSFLNPSDSSTNSGAPRESVSVVGVMSGTPAYMSPEQVRGDDLDARADIFALGLLFYEMSTGRQAFGGKTGGATIEAILTRAPAPVRSLNPQIPPQLEEIINKCLEKNRDRRYSSAADIRSGLQQLKRASDSGSVSLPSLPAAPAAAVPAPSVSSTPSHRFPWKPIVATTVALVALSAIPAWLYSSRRARALTQLDTIVLADFTNKTGDAIFDDTLRQGLAAQLQQSPFLSLVSDQRIQQTLRLMDRPPESKLTPEVASDLCQRIASKAYLTGSISNITNQYVISISAVNCQTGDSLAQQQIIANGKENVLKSLGEASTKLRAQLGESLKTVHQLDTPIEQATTSSLEALQAYTLGRKTMQGKSDYSAAVPLFERAIQHDSNFAMAYAVLGTAYYNKGEKNLSAEVTRKAYDLRPRVSEWERFYIESHYHHFVAGDLEKAREDYELWSQIYPREPVPAINLGVVYQTLGLYERSLSEFREAHRLTPSESLGYDNLVLGYIHLNRLPEARAAADESISKHLDSPDLHFYLYELAFLKNDALAMDQQVTWAAGKSGAESRMLAMQASTAAYFGKLAAARDLSRQAVASATQGHAPELAAGCEAAAALWEAVYGNGAAAREHASVALAKSNGRDVLFAAALALAFVGDSARARALSEDLARRFPEDTIARLNYVPALRAQLALSASDGPAKALDILTVASNYERGTSSSNTFWANLYPVYVRGEAYLAVHQGAQAAAEFQKILDWPGVALNEPLVPLARLGLARAYALNADTSKSRAAYSDFLTLWQSADAIIPILKQAQSDSGKVQ